MARSRYVNINSTVKGGRQLQALLRKLPDDVTAGVKEALLDAAKIAQAEVVKLVPTLKKEDKRRVPGNLRNALSMPQAIGTSAKGLKATFGFRSKKLRQLAFYAHFVEFGTKAYGEGWGRARSAKKSTRRKQQRKMRSVPARPAQPFMRPGFAVAKPLMRKRIDAAVVKALDVAARKYGYRPGKS